MDKRDIWELFTETGDPMCYLMYKARPDAEAPTRAAAPEKQRRDEGGYTPSV